MGWYTSESFDSVTNTWADATGRGFNNDVIITADTGLGGVTETDTSNELYLNGEQAIYGSTGNIYRNVYILHCLAHKRVTLSYT